MKREEAVEKEGEGDKNKKKADDSHVNLENGSACVRNQTKFGRNFSHHIVFRCTNW